MEDQLELIRQLKNSRVLIVDDNSQNIQVLGNILKEEGYKISIAMNGKETLSFVDKTLPDLILLDIMMPIMDGFEVCKKLKENERTKEIPIIFLTAKTETEDIVKAFQLGGLDYITKPFRREELLARVRTHLGFNKAVTDLKQTTKDLQDLIKMRDRLFSIIAHDLRSPLGSFMMEFDLINDEEINLSEERIKQNMKRMQSTAKNVFNLLQNLLDWSRSQQKLVKYDLTENKILDIVNKNINLLNGMAKDKSIKLITDIDENAIANCDFNSISTVIRNLVSNSLKFTEAEGTITIAAKNTNENVLVSIQDTGIGLSDEAKNRLFKEDEFFSTRGTKDEKGTGLGLLICKDFVESNGGKIWIESEIEKGSTFYFTLPKP